jgi:alpha-ketoglutarate-dependent taurine dioxygenase
MIDIEPIEFPGIDSIKDNIEFYKNKFLSDNIIVFKNANCDELMQNKIAKILGDELNCYPLTQENNHNFYIEDHHKHIDSNPNASKDEILLYWHIEHVVRDRSHTLGVWNMELFKCDKDSGKTYFVDMVDLYAKLSQEDQNFLDKATVTAFYIKRNEDILNEEKKGMELYEEQNFTYGMSKKHWITNEKGIRFQFGVRGTLTSFDGRTPTKEEIVQYNNIYEKIQNNVLFNEDIRMVLKWEQGYLAIPDLFKLAHAVSGGFKKEERRLKGVFALENI